MSSPQDITEEFTIAASALPLGELIKDENFTLMESVGALEIMDPKMDSGFLQPGESLEPDYDISQQLSSAQVIGLMDQILRAEAAWHQGNPLAQTLFTCLYIDNLLESLPRRISDAKFKYKLGRKPPDDLVDLVLRAYCCAVVKACDFVHAQITKEQYYEDEDFSAHLYNRLLLTSVTKADVVELLRQASLWVDNAAEVPETHRSAIIDRLSLRHFVLEALSTQPVESPELLRSLLQTCKELLPRIKDNTSLGVPIEVAFSPKVQRKLVSSTPPRPLVQIGFDEAYRELDRTFDDAQESTKILQCAGASDTLTFTLVFMSRHPQPNVFVRCLIQTLIFSNNLFLGRHGTQEFVFDDLNRAVMGVNVVTDPINETAEAPTSVRFQIAAQMNAFSGLAAQLLCELARCLCMNRSRCRRLMTHTLSAWEDMQFEAEDVDGKLQPLTGEVPLMDRLSGAGRVEGGDNGADTKLWSFPLSSWTYAHKLKQMQWIIQLGFELGVYMPHELPAMFWYLRYLSDVRMQHLRRISTFTRREYDFWLEAERKRRRRRQSQGDFSKPDTGDIISRFESTLATIEFGIAEAAATVSLSESLSQLYRALTLLELIPLPTQPYSNASLRHALRMKPFLTISLPPVPSETELQQGVEAGARALRLSGGVSSAVKIEDQPPALATSNQQDKGKEEAISLAHALLDLAEASARQARRDWEALARAAAEDAATTQCVGSQEAWVKKAKDVVRCAIAAGIAVSGVKKGIDAAAAASKGNVGNGQQGEAASGGKVGASGVAGHIKVEVPERGPYHEWWPTPTVKNF